MTSITVFPPLDSDARPARVQQQRGRSGGSIRTLP
jgi:hypothetical protein